MGSAVDVVGQTTTCSGSVISGMGVDGLTAEITGTMGSVMLRDLIWLGFDMAGEEVKVKTLAITAAYDARFLHVGLRPSAEVFSTYLSPSDLASRFYSEQLRECAKCSSPFSVCPWRRFFALFASTPACPQIGLRAHLLSTQAGGLLPVDTRVWTSILTQPLTVLSALHRFCFSADGAQQQAWQSRTAPLVVHLIGANGYEEQYGVEKWGLVLNLLPPGSFSLTVCFVGPEVEVGGGGGGLASQTATLKTLQGRQVTVLRVRGLYHDAVDSLPFPDLVLAQNAGMQCYFLHWGPTLQACRSRKLRLFVTAFDSAENARNLECIDFFNDQDIPIANDGVHSASDPKLGGNVCVTPWSTGKYRRSSSDGGARRARYLVYQGRSMFPTLNIAHCDEKNAPGGAKSVHLDGSPELDNVYIYGSNFFCLALDFTR